MPTRERMRWFAWVLLFACVAVVISGVLGVALYRFPLADDYCRIVDVRAKGGAPWTTLRLTAQTYMHWSGRWSTFLVHYSVLGSIDPLRSYPVPLLFLGGLQWGVLILFFRWVFELSKRPAALAGTVFYAVLLTSMPAPQESVFWVTGAIEYQLAFTSGLLLFIGLLRAPDCRGVNLLLAIATIVVCGEHELVAAAVVAAMAGTVWLRRHEGLATRRYGWLTAAAGVGLLLTAVAPGNSLRAKQQLPAAYSEGIHAALSEFIRLIPQFLSDPRILAACALWVLFVAKRTTPVRLDGRWSALLAMALTAAITLLILLAPPFLLGEPVARSSNLALSVLMAGTATTLFLYRGKFTGSKSLGLQLFLKLTLICGLIVSPNVRQARAAYQVPLADWRRQMTAQLTAGGDDVVINATTPPSPLLNAPVVWAAERDHWLNKCVATFMHVRSVAAAEGCSSTTTAAGKGDRVSSSVASGVSRGPEETARP